MLLFTRKIMFRIWLFWWIAYIILALCIANYWMQDSAVSAKADIMIIFGNRVNPNGILSAILQDRLDTAIVLCKKNTCPKKIIVSWWFGKE